MTVPGLEFLGRVAGAEGTAVGTCFQVEAGVLVTARHVLRDAGAAELGDVVRVAPIGGGPARDAVVARVDDVHDLAVLTTRTPLAGSCVRLIRSDAVRDDEPVTVAGHPTIEDPGHTYQLVSSGGRWRGPALRENVLWSRLQADAVMPGMSGAPVLRAADRAVAGVVSGRYNSADGWLANAVWVARVEDLRPLLDGVARVEIDDDLPSGTRLDVVLAVSDSRVHLSGAGEDVTADHRGVRAGLVNALHDVRRERARPQTVVRDDVTAVRSAPGVVSLRRAGELLAESFLPVPVAQALARVLHRAERAHVPVRFGVEAPGHWPLPWEALPEPVTGRPLVLHELVSVYRRVPSAGSRSTPAGGPLRIVVAIASPETGGGPLLDYERELSSVLDAVHSAHRSRAVVRIVPFATTAAIRAVLDEDATHVLHLSAHGAPGLLHLEDERGNARGVDAETLVREAIPPGRMPRVISLAACYTDAEGEDGAQSFAAQLARRGAGAVIATQTSVTDVYATQLFARVYAELAGSGSPDVVAAVAQSRRAVQQNFSMGTDALTQAVAGMDEWSVVSVLASAPAVTVVDGDAPAGRRAETVPDLKGLLARPVGQFVGRRHAQRVLPGLLLSDGTAGVLLHGIGGIGKTTLAAELVRRLLDTADDWRLVTVTGTATVDGVLAAVADVARRDLLRRQELFGDAAVAVQTAGRVDVPWRDRFGLLREDVLAGVRILLVLDNFEDNLAADAGHGWSITDPNLAGLLAAWLGSPGRSRLLITCRYPFALGGRLHAYQVPPLSLAETRKLLWSLPRLDRHAADESGRERVWRTVGGHPRALEYLDALLPDAQSGTAGSGRFADITDRLRDAVQDRLGPDRAAEWLGQKRTLDAALADTVTLAADDVLLTEHLDRLAAIDGAVTLLAAISVYREPVDRNALLFHVGVPDPNPPAGPDPGEAVAQIRELLARYQFELDDLGDVVGPDSPLTPTDRERLEPLVEEVSRPPEAPFAAPAGLDGLIRHLSGTGLVATLDDGRIVMHRWTATELHQRWDAPTSPHHRPALVASAHREAAAYWRWRVNVWPQDRTADLHDMEEARHHLLANGDSDAAGVITEYICDQLHTSGAWDRETSLIHDTLRRLPPNSPRRPAYFYKLGVLAQARGDYAEAERRFQQALDRDEELGNRAGAASSYGQLGVLAQARGDYPQAERRYRQALAIDEELGNRAGAANTHHQLGILAQDRGDYSEAERRYRQALTTFEELGNRAATANTHHQLGILAQNRGDYSEAERRYRQALTTFEELGNRAATANTHHQLGILAQIRHDYAEAERRYQQALTIDEELGNRAGAASSYGQLGMLAQDREDYSEAERRYRQALTTFEELGNRAEAAISHHQLGMLAQERGDHSEAERRYQQALTIDEELGNRAGAAISHHQLGMLAQDRGDRSEAERRYQQALTTFEELGHRASAAASISQLGVLRADMNDAAGAVPLHCRALAIRLGIGLPEAGFDIVRLRDLRTKLDETTFTQAAGTVLDDQSLAALIAILEDADEPEHGDGT
ncbi:tetratricopeptide repeat protein [Catenuloplanes atrovinosus]|uniref:Tetratricopeptide (TPR) repeat protein n=1 Tax=Catenuloplanes atrovinosus TaxID=137266 RepID=A0AAE4CA02_9ACTN|nr:tetratricopeptide repeat protein [Catenuloplanes atrovinosus]MDR7276553.1 tetratricopeptide (TPR) repeat protein [Catenuloplanes atrovinosus]